MIGAVSGGSAASLSGATVREAWCDGERYLREAGVDSARLDAELVLGEVLRERRERLYLDFDRRLSAADARRFGEMLRRRSGREPLAYILGEKEFWSLDFIVSPAVLVPRPETECLVEAALGLICRAPGQPKTRVLDLGTGSGAIVVSLARERRDLELYATDLSVSALPVARLNARRHGVDHRIRFLVGDLFEPLRESRKEFHLLVSNPPYVSRREMADLSPDVREWEPWLALCGGDDGLDFHRRIIQEAPLHLVEEGFVALEIGAGMAEAVLRLFAAAGCYAKPVVYQDLAGRNRVVTAQLSA